jgi:hypothetical protein
MKKLILTTILFYAYFSILAQNSGVILAPNFIPDIALNQVLIPLPIPITNNNPTDPSDGYDGAAATCSQNIQMDRSGKILFFIVDEFIYDRKGRLLGEMYGVTTNDPFNIPIKGISEVLIIPVPGICDEYYIVSGSMVDYLFEQNQTPAEGFFSRLKINYCENDEVSNDSKLIDLNGDDSYSLMSTLPYNPASHNKSISFACSQLRNDNTRILAISLPDVVHFYEVNQNTITHVSTLQLSDQSNEMASRCETEIVSLPNGNYRISKESGYYPTTSNESGKSINVFDIDDSYTLIPGSNHFIEYFGSSSGILPNFYGMEFCKDGSKLYVTHTPTQLYNNYIDVISFSNGTYTRQALNENGMNDFSHSQIELSIDNELIFATSNRLSKIKNPELPFTSPNWVDGFMSINYGLSYNIPYTPSLESGVYLLNDQIDGMDYDDNFILNEQCCILSAIYDKNSYSASTSSTWEQNIQSGNSIIIKNPLTAGLSNHVYIKENLMIPKGKVVTIKNMVLHFAKNARLIVENGDNFSSGGKLILDNTTLTSDNRCSDELMWMGVEVWGKSNLPQSNLNTSKQGVLEMKNNSIIENAMIGVLLSRRGTNVVYPTCDVELTYTGSYLDSYNGGIVKSTNSFFNDNQRGVYFRKYLSQNLNNLSGFYNTEFNWHETLKNPQLNVLYHAQLEETHGVKFYSCDFTNDYPKNLPYNYNGIGISSVNSQFYVNATLTGLNPQIYSNRGTFQNLYMGIYALNGGSIQSFECSRQDFTNCVMGLYAQNINNEKILLNNFDVRKDANLYTIGAYLINSTGYKIEENYFKSFSDPLVTIPYGKTYGLAINNSKTAHNEVYKNRFRGLHVGCYAEGVNGIKYSPNNPDHLGLDPYSNNNELTMRGLQYICNSYESSMNQADIQVVSGQIDYFQGRTAVASENDSRLKAARNSFATPHHSSKKEIEIDQSAQDIQYVHLNDFNQTPHDYTFNKVYLAEAKYGNNQLVYANSTMCPSRINQVLVGPKLMIASYLTKIEELNNRIDNGNTTQLLNLVATTSTNDLKNILLSYSPYLSDEVLLAYIQKNPSTGHLKQVLIANSNLSSQVIQAINSLNLPIGVRNQINNAQNLLSGRMIINSEKLYYLDQISLIKDQVIQDALLNSSDEATLDELIEVIKDYLDPRTIKMLLSAYLYKGDMVKVQEVKDQLIAIDPLDEFLTLNEVEEEIRFEESTSQSLNLHPNQKVKLENIKNNANDKKIADRARVLLTLSGEEFDTEPIIDVNALHMPKIITEEDNKLLETTKNVVSLYPNPSTGLVNFDFQGVQDGALSIEIYDLSGKLMYQFKNDDSNGELIDLSALHKGLYLVEVRIDDQLIEVQKLELK